MKRLITIVTLLALALIVNPLRADPTAATTSTTAPAPAAVVTDNSIAVSGELDASYQHVYLQQGVVAGNNIAQVGLTASVSSFVLGVDTYTEVSKEGLVATGYKETDFTGGYKFTSLLADLELGVISRNADNQFAFNNVKTGIVPFVGLTGNVTKYFNWGITYLDDIKDKTNNYEAFVSTRIPVVYGFELVPTVWYGFNDPGVPTIALLKTAKHYGTGQLDLAYPTKLGTFAVGYMAHRNDVSVNTNQATGWEASYKWQF